MSFLLPAVQAEAVGLLLAGTSVDLHGVPGSGRSSLLSSIGDKLADHGRQVRWVRGVAALAERPLEPLALAGLLGQRPTAQTTPVAAAVFAVVDAVRDDRTVLVVDDVDDLDQVTVGVLAAAHADHPFPLLSASAPRPRTACRTPRLPTATCPGVVLEVPALTYLETRTLLVDLLGPNVDGAVVSRLFNASGGIPGIVRAIVDGAVRAGVLVRTDGVWNARGHMWTPSLHCALEPMLRDLTPAALEGLHVLSLAGVTSLSTARALVEQDVLEELDGYRLLRLLSRGEGLVVGVHPPALAERSHRLGVTVRHLYLEERLARLPEKMRTLRRPTALSSPLSRGDAVDQVTWPDMTPDAAITNQLLVDHWYRKTERHRDEWEAARSPRTAAAYLYTLLVNNADSATVHSVIDSTPRVGERPDIATFDVTAFDVWSAVAVGMVDQDLDRVRDILDRSRAQTPAVAPLLDAIQTHVTLLLDHAADPSTQPLPEPGMPPRTTEMMLAARAELLTARGRPAEAVELLGRPNLSSETGNKLQTTTYGVALLVDGRFDEALQWSMAKIDEAHAYEDISTVTALAYTAAVVLMLQLRLDELRRLLAMPYSTGMHSPLRYPAELALLSMGAVVALEDGQTATARDLCEQARKIRFGAGWYPLASHTYAVALLDSADLPPTEAQRAMADQLWAEFDDLRARHMLSAALWVGTLAIARQPERCCHPHRKAHVQALLDLAHDLPAGTARHAELFVETLDSDDPGLVLANAEKLIDAGWIYGAVRAYAHGLRILRDTGRSAKVTAAMDDARTRLGPYGPDAVAILNRLTAPTLTGRELEVARLAAEGLSNRTIADRLTISVRTVENHLHRVFQKIGVDDRAALARALVV